MKVLVTGGAGFIGSHIVDALVARGDEVSVLDALVSEVHGDVTCNGRSVKNGRPPVLWELQERYPDANLQFHWGNVAHMEAVGAAIQDCDAVIHCAARLGVERSFADPSLFVRENTLGTAVLLEAVRAAGVKRVIIASSMGVYGEGMALCPACGPEHPRVRSAEQIAKKEWWIRCSVCDSVLTPGQTGEITRIDPGSPYSLTKYDQEMLARQMAARGDFDVTVLRYFNVYGPRQALNNPYSGVAAIFASNLLHGMPPAVYEDGQQTRDFTHVSDVVRANLLALDVPTAGHVLNIATGVATTVADLARLIARTMRARGVPRGCTHNKMVERPGDEKHAWQCAECGHVYGQQISLEPMIRNEGRVGDVRHCIATVAEAWRTIGYRPKVALEDGIGDLVAWVQQMTAK